MGADSYRVAERVAGARGEPADRVASFVLGEGRVFVVADGAGNSAGGRLAAEAVVDAVKHGITVAGFEPSSADSWARLLTECDRAVARVAHGGETTAVVAYVTAEQVVGASAGDSEAWLLDAGGSVTVLTERQHRKPLLGSGEAVVAAFSMPCEARSLLLATDGLFKYAPADRVIAALSRENVASAADDLLALPHLGAGGLPDDVGLVLCLVGR